MLGDLARLNIPGIILLISDDSVDLTPTRILSTLEGLVHPVTEPTADVTIHP